MKSTGIFLFLLLVLLNTAQGASNARLNLLVSNSRALCLDGTPAGFYLSEGNGINSNNFLIFFQGGGACGGASVGESLADCVLRSKTDLGSSSFWSQTESNDAIFSDDAQDNPLFYSWTKVYVKYCDGSFYQGSSQPIQVGGNTIYFRGYDIVTEIFQVLKSEHNLSYANTVVLGGASAGALGSIFWVEYLKKILPEDVLLILAPDSGYFPYIEREKSTVTAQMIDIITDNNREILQPQGCPYLYDNENINKCQSLQFMIDLVTVPTFIINSLYDEYTLRNILGVTCTKNQDSLQNCSDSDIAKVVWLHSETLKQLNIIKNKNPTWGMWAISCVLHVFSFTRDSYSSPIYSVPQRHNQSEALSLQQFIELQINGSNANEDQFHIDQAIYPENGACNGLPAASSY